MNMKTQMNHAYVNHIVQVLEDTIWILHFNNFIPKKNYDSSQLHSRTFWDSI